MSKTTDIQVQHYFRPFFMKNRKIQWNTWYLDNFPAMKELHDNAVAEGVRKTVCIWLDCDIFADQMYDQTVYLGKQPIVATDENGKAKGQQIEHLKLFVPIYMNFNDLQQKVFKLIQDTPNFDWILKTRCACNAQSQLPKDQEFTNLSICIDVLDEDEAQQVDILKKITGCRRLVCLDGYEMEPVEGVEFVNVIHCEEKC